MNYTLTECLRKLQTPKRCLSAPPALAAVVVLGSGGTPRLVSASFGQSGPSVSLHRKRCWMFYRGSPRKCWVKTCSCPAWQMATVTVTWVGVAWHLLFRGKNTYVFNYTLELKQGPTYVDGRNKVNDSGSTEALGENTGLLVAWYRQQQLSLTH